MPTFIDNKDGSYSQQILTAFDPVATEQQIDALKVQAAAAADLAARNVSDDFQPQIDTLQALLDAFKAQFPKV